jgi:hypothetical protein
MLEVNLDQTSQLLLSVTQPEPGTFIIDPSLYDWRHVFRRASVNRVLLPFCRNLASRKEIQNSPQLLETCSAIITKANSRMSLASETLGRIDSSFKQASIPYLLCKTVSAFECVPNDLDILVPEDHYHQASNILGTLVGDKGRKWQSKDEKGLFEGENFFKTDLHQKFTWLGSQKPFLTSETFFENSREAEFFGSRYPIPGPTHEFMLNSLNVMFERFYITLNLLFTLKRDYPQTDMEKIQEEAERYHWTKALERFLKTVERTQQALAWEKENPLPPLSFPVEYRYRDILITYAEQFLERAIVDISLMPYNLSYSRWKARFSHKEQVGIYGHWFPFETLPRRKFQP